ncbi:hypothetical protein QQF64_019001 [Cirrhinus molitorella]|uniref:Chloride channel CLIC-like protein 1 n=1 Tax=Cirrhinus molitorella TaxID=172907 RepID=A0ABR3LFN4_9TELE
MKVSSCSLLGFWSLLIFSSLFVFANTKIHRDEDDAWIDPYDMLNYDPTTKRMRKPTKSANYPNMPTKRRKFRSESCEAQQCPDVSECTSKLESLQQEFDELKKRTTTTSVKPIYLSVFKQFLSRFLKETSELGMPDDGQTSMHYDAEVKLSKHSLVEIQKLLNEENDWTTEAMDEALSQILVRFKLHYHEAWKWRFEDTLYVYADTALKVSLIVLTVAIICTVLWFMVSWFVHFWRMNWFHFYKIWNQPPPAVGQRQAPQLREHEETLEGGDAPQPLQDNRKRVNQAGHQSDQGFRAGDAYDPQNKQEDGSMDLPRNFSSGSRGTQKVEILCATGNMSRDESDFQQQTEKLIPGTKEKNATTLDKKEQKHTQSPDRNETETNVPSAQIDVKTLGTQEKEHFGCTKRKWAARSDLRLQGEQSSFKTPVQETLQ